MVPGAARAQASVYGEFSVSDLTNLAGTGILYGATTGVLYDGFKMHNRIIVAADIQGRFVHKSGENLNGVTIGPRFEVPIAHGFAPYGEFTVGFARYNDPNNTASTDATLQLNAGLAKQVSSHLDVAGDYSYAQYYGLGGEYNPKTFSVGLIYHFVKR
jgi:outer membrane autotransporter protein